MYPSRTPYGSALGFVNQFNYRGTTAGDISGQTTPNVTNGELFYVNNTGAVNITNFILDNTANNLVNYEGKVIRVFSLNSSTTIANAGSIFLQGSSQLASANAFTDLMHSRGNWFEVGGGVPSRSDFVAVLLGTAGGVTIDNGTKVVLFQGVSGAQQIKAISGGYIGQTVTFASPTALNTGGITVQLMTGGNLVFVGTNAFEISTNAAIQFIKTSASRWLFIGPSTGASIIGII